MLRFVAREHRYSRHTPITPYYDLTIFARQWYMLKDYNNHVNLSGVADITAGVMGNPQLSEVYWENFVDPRRESFAYVLERGKSRSELREDLDIDVTIDLLADLLLYLALFNPKRFLSYDLLDRVENLLMEGLTPKYFR